MAAGPYPWDKVGADRGKQDPNDPSIVGTYKDAVDELTPEQKSPLVNFPQAPDPAPFTIKGGIGG